MMRLTVRKQSQHVGDADEGQQRNPLQCEVRQGDRGGGCIGGELNFEHRHEDVARSDERSDGQPETERMPRRPYQDDRSDGHRRPVHQHPRQQVKRIPRKARHHDDHPAERCSPRGSPTQGCGARPRPRSHPGEPGGRACRQIPHSWPWHLNDGPDRMPLSGGSAPDGLRFSPNDSGASAMPLGSPRP